MKLEEIRAQLKINGISLAGNFKSETLVEKLNAFRAVAGESPIILDVEEELPTVKSDHKQSPTLDSTTVLMVCNVKHDGILYSKDSEATLEDDTAVMFKKNGWAK